MPHREEKVKEEVKKALLTGVLYLSHSALLKFPTCILTPTLEKLYRLDLSYNNIHHLPKEIVILTGLKELWLQNNPISELPFCIDNCSRLEVIDIRQTKIHNLPPNIAMLKKLVELDWRDTPLEKKLSYEYNLTPGDINGLKGVYHKIHERDAQKEILKDFFSGVHFLKDADKPNIADRIYKLVEVTRDIFC